MRITLVFSFDTLALPIAYNILLQGFIYNALSRSDPDYSYALHNKGRDMNIDKCKLFTFGRLSGQYRICGSTIIFENQASLEIRSPDPHFVSALFDGIQKSGEIHLENGTVSLSEITVSDRIITESSIKCRTQAPLCFKQSHPGDESFDSGLARTKLLNNAKEKWLAAGYSPEAFLLDISFPNTGIKRTQCLFKGTYITGWETAFELSGDPSVLDFIYNTGIGARNSQGFGMFDILPER